MSLFSPFQLRTIEFRNRIGVSPMCQYSAVDGHPGTWHLVHLGSRAVGGAGLVVAEASGVSAIGRISPGDTGLYLDSHVDAWRPIAKFIRENGAVPGIQLAHAGRKASTRAPWLDGSWLPESEGGWTSVAPSAIPFSDKSGTPHALTIPEIHLIIEEFRAAARRALAAGFQFVEIHSAHGYLLHEFLSPFSNHREDEYGGSFENRTRLLLQTAQAVRELWPQELPVSVRISATDWKEGGWDLPQSIELARRLKAIGIDIIDVSSGGNLPQVQIPVGPGYQVEFSEAIRREAGIPTAAVGFIVEPTQADTILLSGQADMVFLAREFLRDPYWPRRAAKSLGLKLKPPVQYERAW